MRNHNGEWACPYCKHDNDHSDDHRIYEDGEHEVECGHCGKHVDLQTIVSFTHITTGSCERNKELPHYLKKEIQFPDGEAKYACRKCKTEFYTHQLADGKYPRLKQDEYVIDAPHSKEETGGEI